MSDTLRAELTRVASRLGADGIDFVLERPRDAGHGDLATNLAMVLARRERANPRKVAERVLQELQLSSELVERTEIAGPGFINFWLAGDQLAGVHRRILSQGPDYGRSDVGHGVAVNVEFVSANPTGPLHVGHGRQAVMGDAIAPPVSALEVAQSWEKPPEGAPGGDGSGNGDGTNNGNNPGTPNPPPGNPNDGNGDQEAPPPPPPGGGEE